MLSSLTSAVSGLQAYQEELDVIGNNIANVNTTGFKSSAMDLSDSFSNTLASSSLNGGSTEQIGTGVVTSAVETEFTQGAITTTGVQTNLAISGSGFFVVKDPVNGDSYVTRAGDFQLDANGYLVTAGGLRVQGYNDSALTTVGDIQINGTNPAPPSTTSSTATMTGYTIDATGKITIDMSDGSEYVGGQILMQNLTNPQSLVNVGNSLYSNYGAAGPLGGSTTPTPAASGTNGLGQILSGSLEQSNVDLSTEFSNLIQAERAFQANARVITTSDEILQELDNLKH